MNRDGIWVGQGQAISTEGEVTGDLVKSRTAGFWITGLMSPFIIGGVGALAYDMAKAQRAFEATGDDKDLRSVTVKRWGLPYQAKRVAGSLDAGAIAARAEAGLRLGFVPEGVRFLTAAVDIQSNRFEILVRGWGINGESWVIDDRVMTADPATSPSDWDKLLLSLEGAAYPLADGSGRSMRVLALGYDSGGQDGVTLQAYGAWRRSRKRRGARHVGKFDGRDGWTVLPLKGASSLNAASLVVTYPDSQRKDRMLMRVARCRSASSTRTASRTTFQHSFRSASRGRGTCISPALFWLPNPLTRSSSSSLPSSAARMVDGKRQRRQPAMSGSI